MSCPDRTFAGSRAWCRTPEAGPVWATYILVPVDGEPGMLVSQGMVFTIDPGVFIRRDVPIHIEDTVVVTANGCEGLNHFTHDLVVV